jgi:hypothetical protein
VWLPIVLAQPFLLPSDDGVYMSALCAIGGLMAIYFCLRHEMLVEYPVSTIMLLGFAAFHFLLPPVVTLAEGNPLTNNLVMPVAVQLHALACFLALIVAHVAYQKLVFFRLLRNVLAERVNAPLGLFKVPSNVHMLFIGGVGLLAVAVQVVLDEQSTSSVANRVVQGFVPLAYLPYALLLRRLMGDSRAAGSKWVGVGIAYSIPIVLLSVARGGRGAMLLGATSLAISYLYGVLAGVYSTRAFRWNRVVGAMIGVVVIGGPLADLATAMVMSRGQIRAATPAQIVSDTFVKFRDKEGIRQFRAIEKGVVSDWDEGYIDNVFFARTANLKFVDNSVVLASTLSEPQRDYFRDVEVQRALSTLPEPAIRALKLPIDKGFALGASAGDHLLYTATQMSNAMGGFRTGAIEGTGFAVFGWYYPLFVAFAATLLFAIADSRAKVERTSAGAARPLISPLVLVSSYLWFFCFTSAAMGTEDIAGLFALAARAWIQDVLLYGVAFWLTLWLARGVRHEAVG